MLPTDERLHTSAEFSAVVRRGRRAGTSTLVLHLLHRLSAPGPARAGFVVSGKVGNSVLRHRITRRLRPLIRRRLQDLPPGTDLVVRALPAAASATTTRFDRDLTDALRVAVRRAGLPPIGLGSRPPTTLADPQSRERRP